MKESKHCNYVMMQNEYEKNPTISPITLCWLWHPLVYGVPYQDVVKLPSNNYVKKLSNSYEGNIKEASESCIGIVYRDYPIFPKLSQREKQFLKKMGKPTRVEQLFEKPPWTPPICYMRPIEPSSFTVNLHRRYNKYFVSNLSGHVMRFIIMSQLFDFAFLH